MQCLGDKKTYGWRELPSFDGRDTNMGSQDREELTFDLYHYGINCLLLISLVTMFVRKKYYQ